MDDAQFQQFLDLAHGELERKQEALKKTFGLGSFPRWRFDQPTQSLRFFDRDDALVVEADVIDIGSFSTKSSTWKWAWSNDSVLPALRQRADPLRGLTDITGFEVFSQDSAFEIDGESMAWELAALSVKHLGAAGCYRAPSSSRPLLTFLAIMEIRRVSG